MHLFVFLCCVAGVVGGEAEGLGGRLADTPRTSGFVDKNDNNQHN